MPGRSRGKLPERRIEIIMRANPSLQRVSRDSLVLMVKATELFITQVTKNAYEKTNAGTKLDYHHVADAISEIEKYDFLRANVPKKRKFGDCMKMIMAEAEEKKDSDGKTEDAL